MPRCCGGSTCACKVEEGLGILISGTGQAGDPFVITSDIGFAVLDNATFDLTLTGTGTSADPRTLSVNFSPTAKLDHIPDVDAAAPTNGQVLAYNTSTGKWQPSAPTTAAAGAVQHDTSISGDGSVGSPLSVVSDNARYIGETASGVGLTDLGMMNVVHHFANAAGRTTAFPAPTVNTLTMLDTNLGVIDYWTGTAWAPLLDRLRIAPTGQFQNISGAYVAGATVTEKILQVATTTDGSGVFDVVSPTDLTGFAGVLSVMFQETGATAWKAVLFWNTDRVSGRAYRMDDGTLLIGTAVTGMVNAALY